MYNGVLDENKVIRPWGCEVIKWLLHVMLIRKNSRSFLS